MFEGGWSPGARLDSERWRWDASVYAVLPLRYFALTAGEGERFDFQCYRFFVLNLQAPDELRINKRKPLAQSKGLELVWDSERFSLMSLRMMKVGGWLHGFRPESAAKNLCARVRPKGTFSWTAKEGGRSEVGAGIISTHILSGTKKVISPCSVSWRGQSLRA